MSTNYGWTSHAVRQRMRDNEVKKNRLILRTFLFDYFTSAESCLVIIVPSRKCYRKALMASSLVWLVSVIVISQTDTNA